MSKGKKVELIKAMKIAEEFIEISGIEAEIAGSIRRGESLVGDIDLVVKNPDKVGKQDNVEYKGMNVNMWYASKENWGSMLFFATGPKGYGIGYRRKAKKAGMKLNRYGLWKGDEVVASRSEKDIYKALNKSYKEPCLRGKK